MDIRKFKNQIRVVAIIMVSIGLPTHHCQADNPPVSFMTSQQMGMGGATALTSDGAYALMQNPARLASDPSTAHLNSRVYLQRFSPLHTEVGSNSAGEIRFGQFWIGMLEKLNVTLSTKTECIAVGYAAPSAFESPMTIGASVYIFNKGDTLNSHREVESMGLNLGIEYPFKTTHGPGTVALVMNNIGASLVNTTGINDHSSTPSLNQIAPFETRIGVRLPGELPNWIPLHEVVGNFDIAGDWKLLPNSPNLVNAISVGMEKKIGDNLVIRTGLNQGNWTAGIGITIGWFQMDWTRWIDTENPVHELINYVSWSVDFTW